MQMPFGTSSLNDKRTLASLSLVVAAIFFLALNAVSSSVFRSTALDLTEENIYTLSEGTERAIANIDEPITFRLFVSSSLTENFPQYAIYADRVRQMLERYAEMSNGKIRLEVYDPEPFSDAEDLAASYGLAAIPINQQGTQAYFGLVGSNSVDKWEKIPFFHQAREGFIEQDLTRMVAALGPAERPVVGLITGLPISGSFQMGQGFTPPWPIVTEINEIFRTRTIPTDTAAIPEEVDVLFIAHPTDLPEQTLYAIDQYVMRGGKVLLMMDPVPEMAPRQRTFFGMSPAAGPSSLPRLLEAWGVRMRPDAVAADGRFGMLVNTGERGPNRIAQYLVWLRIPGDFIRAALEERDAEEPIVQGVDNLVMASPGIIDALEGRTTTVSPIITTTRNSMAVRAQQIRMRPDFNRLIREFQPGNTLLVLGARITGEASSAFDSRPQTSGDDENEGENQEAQNQEGEDETPPEHVAQSQGPINVVMIADTDMLHEQFWRQAERIGEEEITVPLSGNAYFVLNALDQLSGANYMLGLRGRGSTQRSFTLVEEMMRDSRQRLEQRQRELQQELEQTRERLQAARVQTEDGQVQLTDEQRAEIERFQQRFFEIRRNLRRVQFELRQDVEALHARLKFFNIGVIPILIALIAIGLGIYRYRRRRRRFETS